MKPLLPATALLAAAAAAMAQYKVVAPDGKVTYTDRPIAAVPSGAKVSQIGRDSSAAAAVAASPLAGLPFELRQVAERFPVTLYASTECAPCDRGRRLLQQRGIPYVERLVQTDDDQVALERLSGARTVPVLAVGAQLSRGWLESEWRGTLDLAGYPAQSQLPRDWQAPAVTPLAPRPEAAPTPPAPTVAAPAPRPAPAPESGDAPGIRF